MDDRRSFAILVYEDVEPIDIGATFGVLSMARRIVPDLEMFLVAEHAGPVRLTNGLVVQAEYGYADCPRADALIVTGGSGWVDQCVRRQTLDFVLRMSGRGLVASVCTGGCILAASGLLDGRQATTRRVGADGEETPLQKLASSHPQIESVEAVLVDSGAVITGGGVTLGIDTTLHLLERFFGREVAKETARIMEYEVAWEANSRALPTYRRLHGSV